jgi:hypothetical protein
VLDDLCCLLLRKTSQSKEQSVFLDHLNISSAAAALGYLFAKNARRGAREKVIAEQ